MFGSTIIKQFGEGGSLKFLAVTCHRIINIKNWCGLIQKGREGFIKYFSRELKKIPIPTKKYKNGGVLKKYVLDLKIRIRNEKKEQKQQKFRILWELLL